MTADIERPINVEGIVLRTYPSREADLMLRVLTKSHGKLSILAKHSRGSKKHFGGGVDLFDIGNFELSYGKGPMPLLKSFRSMIRLAGIRTDLDKIALSSLLCEASDHLTIEEGPEGDDFEILSGALSDVEKAATITDHLSATYRGLSQLLSASGFLDDRFSGRGSVHKLIQLIDALEECTERKLESRAMVMGILKKLHLTNPSTAETVDV